MTTQKRHPKRSRHGFHRLTVAIQTRNLGALDRRCSGAKALLGWRSELLTALGGEANVSPQKRALVETACRTRLLLDACDAFILSLDSPVNRRRRALYPVVRERQTLADSLLRTLTTLGLERIELDGGMLPDSWVEKVQPREPEQNAAAIASEDRP